MIEVFCSSHISWRTRLSQTVSRCVMIAQVLQVPWNAQRWATKNKLNSFEAAGLRAEVAELAELAEIVRDASPFSNYSLDSVGKLRRHIFFRSQKDRAKPLHPYDARWTRILPRPSRCCAVEPLPGASSGNQAKRQSLQQSVQPFSVQYGSIPLESALHIVADCGILWRIGALACNATWSMSML